MNIIESPKSLINSIVQQQEHEDYYSYYSISNGCNYFCYFAFFPSILFPSILTKITILLFYALIL